MGIRRDEKIERGSRRDSGLKKFNKEVSFPAVGNIKSKIIGTC